MEINESNLRTLSEYLNQTLAPEPQVRRPAERFLESVEGNRNYPVLLLHLVNSAQFQITTRVVGAVSFKNYIKRNWNRVDESEPDKIHPEDRAAIKEHILNCMLMSPPSVQKQLSDALAIIGKTDFPNNWPGLMNNMVDKFATGDFNVINGVLQTAHSLFKRYRYEFKSEELWREIKHVLDTFAKPLTDLLLATHNLTRTETSKEALQVIYSSLHLICKIFYSLNYQDLPEFFEDNMSTWMPFFHELLTTEVKVLETDDDNELGVMEGLKSQICDNVALYAQKYDEEFQPFLPGFVTDIWNLLTSTGLQLKYDLLVSNSLRFLTTVASRPHYRKLFEDPTVLASICEKVIIPNIHFREVDEELFEDNPEEYMRRDIEGSDVETRRRSACDLVKALALHFDKEVTTIFSQYVQGMMGEYSRDNSKWKHKNSAVYLVMSMSERGQTQKHGVTQVSSFVPLTDFLTQHILPELTKDVNANPVVKADSIKCILLFRNVLPPEMVVSHLPQLMRHLAAESNVVHSYAALSIEKILTMRKDNGPLLTQEMLLPLSSDLLKGLFSVLHKKGSEENEYVMKAIMRTFSTLQEGVIPFLAELLPTLTQKLAIVAKNPSKPNFNHYMFETITLSIKIVCKKSPEAVTSFEEALFPIFMEILQQDYQEFLPYVMQILSILLDLHNEIPEAYLNLYPHLLTPSLWERAGNVKALTSLLRSFIRRASPHQIESTIKVPGLLGIFQKLISSRVNDHEGFYLIQSMMEFLPKACLDPFWKQVFILLFQRLSSSKTTKYIKGLIVFFSFYTFKFGPSEFIDMVDGIQPQMFNMLAQRLILPDAQKISGQVERKITAVGITKMICQGKLIISGPYADLWIPLLRVLLALFELPQDETTHPDDHYVDVEDTPGYEVAFNQLLYAGPSYYDPLSSIPDPKVHLALSLKELFQSMPGHFQQQIGASLSPEEQAHLRTYFEVAKVSF